MIATAMIAIKAMRATGTMSVIRAISAIWAMISRAMVIGLVMINGAMVIANAMRGGTRSNAWPGLFCGAYTHMPVVV